MYKVWYRNGNRLEVDVIADRVSAMRRGAAIASEPGSSTLRFSGIEDEDGEMVSKQEFNQFLKGYQIRGLAAEPAVCPKYYVEVLAPDEVCAEGEGWVRYAIEQTRVAARSRQMDALSVFGATRVRITPVNTRPGVEV